ncbi:MAG: hypothetical protein AB4058_21225 [Microcystaceae cyanobacterium]
MKVVDPKTLIVDIEKLIETVKNNSQQPQIDETEISEKIQELETISHDSWQIGCGHDLIQILSLGLCKIWGTRSAREVQHNILERELRLAYEKVFFTKTNLYTLIKNWEANNQGYKVRLS